MRRISMMIILCICVLSCVACDSSKTSKNESKPVSEIKIKRDIESKTQVETEKIELEIEGLGIEGLGINEIEAPKATNEEEEQSLKITVNNLEFTATLENNDTAKAFVKLLPMTLTMDDVNGNEKSNFLSTNIRNDKSKNPGTINIGDIMCYSSNCLVMFYETLSTSYSYVSIGHIDNVEGYVNALGSGSVQVTFELD